MNLIFLLKIIILSLKHKKYKMDFFEFAYFYTIFVKRITDSSYKILTIPDVRGGC